jgi:hypothetical protein
MMSLTMDLKEHASVDVNNGFILATTTPATEHDSKYLPYLTLASCHSKKPIKKIAVINFNKIQRSQRKNIEFVSLAQWAVNNIFKCNCLPISNSCFLYSLYS